MNESANDDGQGQPLSYAEELGAACIGLEDLGPAGVALVAMFNRGLDTWADSEISIPRDVLQVGRELACCVVIFAYRREWDVAVELATQLVMLEAPYLSTRMSTWAPLRDMVVLARSDFA